MANITRYYLADFGPRYTGLATVGYTLPGGSRTTSGVSELAAGTGIYGASITHADTISGALMWDTGGGSPVYASEEINTLAGYKLASDGLDSISTTAPSGVASNFREMMVQVWRRFFRKTTKTSSQIKTYADDGTTVTTTQAISNDGTTQTQGAAS